MGRKIDLLNKRFGKLTVISDAPSLHTSYGTIARWTCSCDCGNQIVVKAELLRNGKVKSCGCLKHEHSYNYLNLAGERFGRLVVKEFHGKKNNKVYFLCECDCGKTTIVSSNCLKTGKTLSCGCLHKEILKTKKTKHGLSHSKIHSKWKNMLNRCENSSCLDYKNYGGRGIVVCDEWHDLSKFAEWIIQQGYHENVERGVYTIERIDVNGNYCPQNCKLATIAEQCKNKRNNCVFYVRGKKVILSDLSRITGVNRNTIRYRINHGLTPSQAVGGYFNEYEIRKIDM